mgnify:CR=1 FL=1
MLSLFADQEAKEQWQGYIDDVLATCDTDKRERFAMMKFDAYKNGVLTVAIPDMLLFDWLEQDENIGILRPLFSKHYGDNAKWQYRILGKSPNPQGVPFGQKSFKI